MTKLNETPDYTLTCFHDGECPICNIEINAMKKLDKHNKIEWVDISTDKAKLAQAGLSYEQAMDKMHVINQQNNSMHSGVEGFIQVWELLPYYRRLAALIKKVPFAMPFLNVFYSLFARYRLVLTGKTKKKS